MDSILPLVFSGIGAVLGTLGFWRSVSADRVRLSVRVRRKAFGSKPPHPERYAWAIVVLNQSRFEVTVKEVGVDFSKFHKIPLLNLNFIEGQIPARMRPRETIAATITDDFLTSYDRPILKVYATTACGYTARYRWRIPKKPPEQIA